MAAQIRIFSLKGYQAKRMDDLAEELGGMSKAGQHVIDFYILWHDNQQTESDEIELQEQPA